MRQMKDQGRGSIVNVSSRVMMSGKGMGTCAATKAGIAAATWGWAADLGPHGVRVNNLMPNAATRAMDLAGGHAAADARQASPDHVAPAVAYLLSDLSCHITGANLYLGGLSLGLMRRPRMEPLLDQAERWTPQEIDRAIGGRLELDEMPLVMGPS